MIDKKYLRNLVGEDLLKDAFNVLGESLNNQNVKITEYTVLKGHFTRIENEKLMGVIRNEDYYRELSVVRVGLLGLIDVLGDVSGESSELRQNFSPLNNEINIPRLEVELILKGKWKSPVGLSRDNEVDEDGAVWINKAIFINEIGWKFKIVIRNNSSYPAFYPEMQFVKGNFQQLDKLNKNKPIIPFEEVELDAKYFIRLESTGRDSVEYMNARNLPDELNDLTILLNYRNENGKEITNKFQIIDGHGTNELVKQNNAANSAWLPTAR